MMTTIQTGLARHALGLPNKNKESYRNRFCASPGTDDHAEWDQMVDAGKAVKRENCPQAGSTMFYLTVSGAAEVLCEGEQLSREDAEKMPS